MMITPVRCDRYDAISHCDVLADEGRPALLHVVEWQLRTPGITSKRFLPVIVKGIAITVRSAPPIAAEDVQASAKKGEPPSRHGQ